VARWYERETIHLRRGQEIISPVLNVPRHFPLVLLVEVMHIIGILLYDAVA
jgi:hypothetical protein